MLRVLIYRRQFYHGTPLGRGLPQELMSIRESCLELRYFLLGFLA